LGWSRCSVKHSKVSGRSNSTTHRTTERESILWSWFYERFLRGRATFFSSLNCNLQCDGIVTECRNRHRCKCNIVHVW
jgi:hypothetical protein